MKTKIGKIFLGLFAALTLTACGPTTEQLEDEVKKLASEKMSPLGIDVDDVTLIHQGGNDYTGLITLSVDGEEEQYDIKVTCDGDKFMYEIPALTELGE